MSHANAAFFVSQETTPMSYTSNAVDKLSLLVEDDLKKANQLIFERIEQSIPFISQLSAHLIAAGGKRLRPMLTLASAKLCHYIQGNDHIKLAASVEFIHTATLLHDDVIDDSATRRGKPSVNALWGSKASVLGGDFLFTQAFQLMVSVSSRRVLDILAKTATAITEGEIQQLQAVNNLDITQAHYLKIVKAKTAELFSAACAVGGALAERPEEEIMALAQYGYFIGICFQLIDDILDYTGENFTLGKQVGNDFQEGKMTLPAILAYQQGDLTDRVFWRRTIQEMHQNVDDFSHAVALMNRYHCFEKVYTLAAEYAEKARQHLSIFQDSAYKECLIDLTYFCVNRST